MELAQACLTVETMLFLIFLNQSLFFQFSIAFKRDWNFFMTTGVDVIETFYHSYGEILLSDWLKLVMWLETSKKRAIMLCIVAQCDQ